MITIKSKHLFNFSFLLLTVPYIIFAIGWLNTVLALFLCVVIGFLFYFLLIKRTDTSTFTISYSSLALIVLTAIVLTIFSGVGGYFPQPLDYAVRNPMYRDLIREPWPVFYEETNRALVYYFGYWLIPAAISKIFIPFCTEHMLWQVASVVISIFTAIFFVVILLMIFSVLSRRCGVIKFSVKNTLLLTVIFVFWGTLSLCGLPFAGFLSPPNYFRYDYTLLVPVLIEHFTSKVGVENGNLIIFMNVFNQGIPALLATLLFLYEKKNVRFFGSIGFSLALLGPFPMVGLGLMMICQVVILAIKKQLKIKELLSVENFLSAPLLIVCILFYAGGDSTNIYIKPIFENLGLIRGMLAIALFSFLTFGIYGILCAERKKPFFLSVMCLNFLCIFICVGSEIDFTMRATMPFSFYFMICAMDLMLSGKKEDLSRKSGMSAVLGLSAAVPILILAHSFSLVLEHKTPCVVQESAYTFSNAAGKGDIGWISQYTKLNPSEDFFFRNLTKRKSYSIDNPVIEYTVSESEEWWITKISMTREMADVVKEHCAFSDKEAEKEFYDKLSDLDGIGVIEFEPFTVFPVRSKYTFDESDIDITWKNYHKLYNDTLTPIVAEIDLVNYSSKTISFCGAPIDGYESGISIMQVDKDGNYVGYPYCYKYMSHVVYPNDSEKVIMQIPRPDVSGDYYFKFCLFYTDENNQDQIVLDDEIYEISIR